MRIGITGYIGTGKSTVASILKEKGFDVIDVDKVAHGLLKDEEIKQKIVAKFGEDVLDRKLDIDRKKLGEKVFSDTDKLLMLNNIVHPKLKQEVARIIEENNSKHLVIDVALMEELDLTKFCNKIIVVKADTEQVYNRLVSHYSKRQILIIMNQQKLKQNHDFIIENEGSIDDLKIKVENILKDI